MEVYECSHCLILYDRDEVFEKILVYHWVYGKWLATPEQWCHHCVKTPR